jgi:transposase
MLAQEEFMDVLAMRRQGLSITEIADATGYHPATISRWLKAGGPPAARAGTTPAAIDGRWSKRIDQLLSAAPQLLATSVFEIIRTEGCTGSYPSSVERGCSVAQGYSYFLAQRLGVRKDTNTKGR